jgi:hypothetical protein
MSRAGDGLVECDGDIVGLAETTSTSYNHTGWDPDACLEYVMGGVRLER